MDNAQLDKLEALALAASTGPWVDGGHTVYQSDEVGGEQVCKHMSAEDSAFIAAANPATVLALIALARKAAPDAPAADERAHLLKLLNEADDLLWIASDAMLKMGLRDKGSDCGLPHEVRKFALEFSDEGREGPGALQVRGTGRYRAWIKAARAISHPIGQVSPAIDQAAAPVCHAPADERIEIAQLLSSAVENMRSAEPNIEARFRLAFKLEQLAKRFYQTSDATGKADDVGCRCANPSPGCGQNGNGLACDWRTPGAHHLTPENIAALIADMKACEVGGEVPSIFDRDWRTQCGVIWRVMEHLSSGNAAPSPAARDVLAERRRQVEAEGWTAAHDDAHGFGVMARAAACYALHDRVNVNGWEAWPWAAEWWKPDFGRGDFVKAGALILAEIERIDRAAIAGSRKGDA
jgi:hypothetical protein